MPVYENTYKTWVGEPEPLIYRLLAFSKYTFMQLKGEKKIHTAFIFSWFPFILFLVYIYVRVNAKLLTNLNIPIGQIPQVDIKFFVLFITIQLPLVFFFTVAVGPGLISPDLKNKALPMILSKPISKWEYICGKFMTLFLLLSILTWVQACILFISNLAAVPAADIWRQHFFTEAIPVLLKTIAYALTIIISLSLLVLAFSSITNTRSFASAAFIMFMLGTLIIGGMLHGIFRNPNCSYISIIKSIYIFGQHLVSEGSEPLYKPFISIFIHWAAAILIISSKVKAFIVYKE